MTDKDSSVIRVAIVTGGGTGIGKAAALALQATGHHVALAGRRVEPLEETASESKGKGPDMLAVPSDIRDPDQVRSVFDKTVKTFGRMVTIAGSALMENLVNAFPEYTGLVNRGTPSWTSMPVTSDPSGTSSSAATLGAKSFPRLLAEKIKALKFPLLR